MSAEPAQTTASRQWRSRPWLSRAIHAVVYMAPAAVAVAVSFALTRILPGPAGVAPTLLWWGVLTAVTMVAVVLIERVARRLLPLAALLNLTMVFPDRAPQRFKIARKLGSPSEIRRRLEEAQARGITDTDTETMQVVLELAAALSVHDKATRGHSERVRVFTDMLAAQMRLSPDDRSKLRWASLLHDIGKLQVSHDILNKPGRPSDEEWEQLRRHPAEGARLLGPVVDWLGQWGPAIAQHHERWDGTGYPLGLTGEEISLGARIVAVADCFETMTAPRPYKRPMRPDAARQELVRGAGSQFDPLVVRAFLELSLGRLGRAVGLSGWAAQIPALSRLAPIVGRVGATLVTGASALAVTIGIGTSPAHASRPPDTATPAIAARAQNPSQPAQPSSGPIDNGSADSAQPAWDASSTGSGSASKAGPGSPSGAAGPTPEGLGAPASSATGGAATTTGATASRSSTAPSGSARPAPSSSPTGAPTATALTPTTNTTSTSTVSSTAIPSPTPSPTPQPFNCNACTNTSSSCTSYCNNNNLPSCTTYCQGNNNTACQSYCFGSNNMACTQYCQGSNNPKCVSHCQGYVAGARPPSSPASPPILGVPLLALASRRGRQLIALDRARRFERAGLGTATDSRFVHATPLSSSARCPAARSGSAPRQPRPAAAPRSAPCATLPTALIDHDVAPYRPCRRSSAQAR